VFVEDAEHSYRGMPLFVMPVLLLMLLPPQQKKNSARRHQSQMGSWQMPLASPKQMLGPCCFFFGGGAVDETCYMFNV
jgi:hypothetical protein